MASSFEDCIARIAMAGRIDKNMAKDILRQVHDMAEAQKLSGVADPAMKAAYDLAGTFREAAKNKRLDAVRNAAVRAQAINRIETEAGGKVSGFAQSLRSMLHWVPGAKNANSIEGQWHALSRGFQATLGNVVRQAGLEKVAIRGELDREVAEAVWRLRGGVPDENVKVGSHAKTIADASFKALQAAKERENGVGARIGDAVDYVTHTNWDSRQLRLAAGAGATRDDAYLAWRNADAPRMADKTFEKIVPKEGETLAQAKENFLRSVYDATQSGIHMTNPHLMGVGADDTGYIPPAFEGSRNIAKGVSQQRVIYWKSAGDWLDHMKEFGGNKSIYGQVMNTLDQSARRTALMTKLGTNPQGNLNMIVRHLEEKYRTSDDLGTFQGKVDGLQNVLGRLDGSLNIPVNSDFSQWAEYILSWEALSHLGGVSITHLAAAPGTISSELAHHGINRFTSMAQIVKAITLGRGPKEVQDALADAGAYSHGYNVNLSAMAKPSGGLPGFAAWASSNFIKMTGLPYFLESLQAQGVKGTLMSSLGRQSGLEFSKLEEHQSAILQRYGIGPKEWDLIRGAENPLMIDGNKMITARDVMTLPDAKIEPLLRERWLITEGMDADATANAIKKYRWELSDNLLMYLNDAAERGTVTPGVRERAMILRGSRPGDPLWMLARTVGQFKMWPLAAYNQILGREIAYSLSRGEMWGNLGILVALSTAGGAMRMAVNDMISGRPQHDYSNPMTLLAALGQGGGLGIYGDFLFGETNRMGGGLASTVAGPVVGDADRLLQLYNRFRNDLKENHADKALQHMWPDLAHFAIGHIPFANLVYLRSALDYMLWYHVYEAASPGWWERTNKRLQKEQGRTMVGYTPGGGVPTGLPGLYLHAPGGRSYGLLAGRQ